ncbi:MAG: sulfatase [Holophagales bacterium]|nr:sulfatase [Holophagales bacterium]
MPDEPFEESFLPCASGRRRCGLVAARLVPSEGHSDTRVALPAPGRTRFRFHVEAPPDAELRVGLGAVAAEPAPGASVRFVVRAGRSVDALDELAARAVAWSPLAEWSRLAVDLGELSGGPIVLELESEATGGAIGAWAVPELVETRREKPRVNVLLLSLDTLRADHLSAYGYERPTSPHLDAFARRGWRFETAISQAPWTRPSHRSMLTGLYPSSHGELRSPRLPELFWRRGYRTFALTGGGQLDPKFGFGEGFEAYQGQEWLREPEQLFRRLDARPESRFFLFLHSWEPHDPYEDTRFAEGMPPGRVDGRFDHALWLAWNEELTAEEKAYVEAMYDGDIARADEGIRDLLAGLEARGLLDETIVAITSDHGEAFWEHGTWRHGMHLYDHQVHVPLILWVPPAVRARHGLAEPGAEGTVVLDQVGLIDLYPTLAELAGVPVDHAIQGRSLVPYLRGERLPPREVLSENVNVSRLERKSLRTDRTKLIQTIARDPERDYGPEHLLFDLRRDPGEHENLAPRMPAAVEALLARIAAIRAGSEETLEEAVPADLDPELRKQLQALGYIGN